MIEFLVYKEANTFVGVCLTFDIVEEGKNPTDLMKSIKEAARIHLEAVAENHLSDQLLNRYAPEEYWRKYFEVAKTIEKPSLSRSADSLTVSPYSRSLTTQMA